MKKNLFYVVEKESYYDVGDNIHKLTGWKTITVYEIINNQPKIFSTIGAEIANSSENEIQIWLDNNGYGDEEFNLIQL